MATKMMKKQMLITTRLRRVRIGTNDSPIPGLVEAADEFLFCEDE